MAIFLVTKEQPEKLRKAPEYKGILVSPELVNTFPEETLEGVVIAPHLEAAFEDLAVITNTEPATLWELGYRFEAINPKSAGIKLIDVMRNSEVKIPRNIHDFSLASSWFLALSASVNGVLRNAMDAEEIIKSRVKRAYRFCGNSWKKVSEKSGIDVKTLNKVQSLNYSVSYDQYVKLMEILPV